MTRPTNSLVNSVRKDRTESQKMIQKTDAWKAGKNPWIVVPNINTNEKHKPFVSIRANDAWGNPRIGYSQAPQRKTEEKEDAQS